MPKEGCRLRNLAPFTVGSIIKKLNRIRVQINTKYNRPFPKLRFFWLSEYTYQRRYIKIHPDGRIVGELSRFVSSLVDFSLRGVGPTGRRLLFDPLLPINTRLSDLPMIQSASFCCSYFVTLKNTLI